MIENKQLRIWLIAIITTIILCSYVCTQIIIGHIEKHSNHPVYGNIIEASNNQFDNRENWVKKIAFGCSPWDSC
jgi:hypothetical protein